jgi:hypothetical protein
VNQFEMKRPFVDHPEGPGRRDRASGWGKAAGGPEEWALVSHFDSGFRLSQRPGGFSLVPQEEFRLDEVASKRMEKRSWPASSTCVATDDW